MIKNQNGENYERKLELLQEKTKLYNVFGGTCPWESAEKPLAKTPD